MLVRLAGVAIGAALALNCAKAQNRAKIIQIIESPQSPKRQGFDALTLHELMDRFHVPGLSVAVIRDFKIDWAKAWGMADVDTSAPVNTDTMFQAASMR